MDRGIDNEIDLDPKRTIILRGGLPLAMIAASVALATLVVWKSNHAAPVPDGELHASGYAMGCAWTVRVRPPVAGLSEDQLQREAASLLDRLENQMSPWRDSELSRFNRSESTEWFAVSRELAEAAAQAQEVSRQTGGAFDITVGPLVELWGFGTGKPISRLPADDAIQAARARVGFQSVEARLAPPAIRKARPDVQIELGAIGKGYAAQAIGRLLDDKGAADYLITVGGEVRGRGVSNRGRAWRIGIETPAVDVRRILATIELRDAGVSTSGDYRNFVEIDGRRYCHEIDPRTGRPIENGLAMVSVAHADSAYADAMATGLMVLGPAEGEALARRLSLAAMFVTRGEGKYEVRMTDAYRQLVIEGE